MVPNRIAARAATMAARKKGSQPRALLGWLRLVTGRVFQPRLAVGVSDSVSECVPVGVLIGGGLGCGGC